MLCRRCGATIHDGLRVCPHCGERQARQPSQVSCAHCRHKAPAASSICPRCGHVLRDRRLSGGVLTTVGLLLIAGLALSAGVASHNWSAVQQGAQERLTLIETGISELGGKVLDTASSLAVTEVEMATATPTPVVVLAALSDVERAPEPIRPVVVLAPTTVGGAVGGAGMEPAAVVAVSVADQASPTPEPVAIEQPTATAPPTATLPPTAVPPTATPTATELPPTHTPTLPPTPTTAPATPTAPAVAAAATGGSGLTHSVQAGDNWFSIARRYGITQETLAAYNNSRSTDILQVGQVLRVPAAGAAVSVPTAPPTPVRPTSAPVIPTPAATATPEPAVVTRLAAPELLSPITGDGFTAGTPPVLTWRPVAGFGPQDHYYVLVRFTMRDNQQGHVEDRVTGTSYTVPIWVYDVANPPNRLQTWSVQVRRMGSGNQELSLSPPSENRTFYWR